MDKSIKEEYSLFIRKVLDIGYLITSHNLNNWSKDPINLLKDINLIIKSYWDTTIKLAKYKKRYRDIKGIFENIKLYNTKLEADIKRYIILLNWLILVLATPI